MGKKIETEPIGDIALELEVPFVLLKDKVQSSRELFIALGDAFGGEPESFNLQPYEDCTVVYAFYASTATLPSDLDGGRIFGSVVEALDGYLIIPVVEQMPHASFQALPEEIQQPINTTYRLSIVRPLRTSQDQGKVTSPVRVGIQLMPTDERAQLTRLRASRRRTKRSTSEQLMHYWVLTRDPVLITCLAILVLTLWLPLHPLLVLLILALVAGGRIWWCETH